MTQTAANVRVDKPLSTGAVSVAPKGSTLPTDATTALDTSFKNVGYLDPAGITRTPSRTVNKLYAYGGDMVGVTQSEDAWDVAFTMIEDNDVANGVVFGTSNVTGTTGALTITVKNEEFKECVLVVETKAGDVTTREVWESAILTERGAIVSVDNNFRVYPVTFTALAGANGYGKIYQDDGSGV